MSTRMTALRTRPIAARCLALAALSVTYLLTGCEANNTTLHGKTDAGKSEDGTLAAAAPAATRRCLATPAPKLAGRASLSRLEAARASPYLPCPAVRGLARSAVCPAGLAGQVEPAAAAEPEVALAAVATADLAARTETVARAAPEATPPSPSPLAPRLAARASASFPEAVPPAP